MQVSLTPSRSLRWSPSLEWTHSSSPTTRTRCRRSWPRSRQRCGKKLNHADLVALIKDGVGQPGGRWADLGAGEDNFTRALADLLGPEAHITAIDKDARALSAIDGTIETHVADFTRSLDLHDLDGVVMANQLHFLSDMVPVIEAMQ